MGDAMWTTSVAKDALVALDDSTWVRVSAVEAVRPWILDGKRTEILLAGGHSVTAAGKVGGVIDKLGQAMRRG